MDYSTVMMVATLVMKMLRAVNLVMDCHYSQSLLCHPWSNLQLNATAESMILSNMAPASSESTRQKFKHVQAGHL